MDLRYHMNRVGAALSVLLSVSAPVSCVRDVVMDADEKPQVVVSCIIDDGPEQVLNLSFTKGASKSEAPRLTEAVAVLYDGEEKVGEFQRHRGNEWTLDYSAVPDHTYRLEVLVPGYDPIHAEQQMPPKPAPIKCMAYTHFEGWIEPWQGWEPGGNHFFEPWNRLDHAWPEDEPYPMYETFYVLFESSSSAWIAAMNYNPESGRHEIAESICTDAVPGEPDTAAGQEVYVPLQTDVPNPYKLKEVQPPYDKDSFYNAHLMELYPSLTGKPCYKRFFRLPENKPQVFMISGELSGDYCTGLAGKWGYAGEDTGDKGYILCVTPSTDYERYLHEAYYFMDIQQSTDLSTIYLRDNIYTNISGGLGIFGAQFIRKYPWAATYTYIDSGIPAGITMKPDAYGDPRKRPGNGSQVLTPNSNGRM